MALAEVLTEQELPSKLIDMFYPPSILLTNRFKMPLFQTPQYGKTSWHKRVIPSLSFHGQRGGAQLQGLCKFRTATEETFDGPITI